MPQSLEAYCAIRGVWSAKANRMMHHMAAIDPDLGRDLAAFYRDGMEPQQAIAVVDRVLARFGGRLLAYRTTPE